MLLPTKNRNWPTNLDSWYTANDSWGYSSVSQERSRLQLLSAEIPNLKYKKTLVISWQLFEECVPLYPGKSVEWYSFLGNKSQDNTILTPDSLFTFLARIQNKKEYDLIILDRVVYTGVIGNALSLLQMYIKNLLKKDGLLV
jgi:hypothetical protein